ncbi:hypothetical protein BH20CHL4_BH20CHL4_11190 [soil metagenome]
MFRPVIALMFVVTLVAQMAWMSPAIARLATPATPGDFAVDLGHRPVQIARTPLGFAQRRIIGPAYHP